MDYERFNDSQLLKILSAFGNPVTLRILFLSTYSADYVRTQALLEMFRRNNLQVSIVCGKIPWLRHISVLGRALLRLKKADVVFLAFRGHETLPFLRLMTRKPIIFDSFVSLYDTLCFDRKLCSPDSTLGRMLKGYDAYLCRIANVVLVDTFAHCDYFKREFNAGNVSYLYVECDRSLFKPLSVQKDKNTFVVFWYGKCWPLQGVQIILKAAWILKDDQTIRFRLVGPIRRKQKSLVRQLQAPNVEVIDFIPYPELPLAIAGSDVCLGGHFAGVDKAKRVIAGKTFQFFACGKKTILGDNPANRELFSPGPQVCFVQMDSPLALAEAIRTIKETQWAT